MKCVFCKSTTNVRKAPAYMKAGYWIRESRVFTITTCDSDRPWAERSFDSPFRDKDMIHLYKETLNNNGIL